MRLQTKFLTIPLNKTQEIEVVFRLKTKDKGKNWGEELLRIFAPVRAKSKKYSVRQINQDIARAIKKVRANA